MSVIRHEMEIDASPEAVFELMARMGGVRRLQRGHRVHYPRRARSLPLVCAGGRGATGLRRGGASPRPSRLLGWRTLAGLSCEGCYRLTPSARGSHLQPSAAGCLLWWRESPDR